MKIVLFACNGSFSHTNLAVRCLRAPLEYEGFEVVIVERNLRDRSDDILEALYREHGDVYGFSTYIWNLEVMLDISRDLRSLLPGIRVVFGGPEVSFATERFDGAAWIDHIIRGEGEITLPRLCRAIKEGRPMPRILDGECAELQGKGILYRDGDYWGGEMLYYESSRGCPFRCAYCLSSVSGRVRAKSVEETLDDLRAFSRLSSPVKIIKFVDRTFNFDPARANRIWEALLEDSFDGHYHFEICASLLDEESFSILQKFPRGKIQLEIGLQSTNPATLAAISRGDDSAVTLAAAKRIRAMGNIHVHLDLIAGLPHEDYERFRQSFNDAYGCADMLQLGFLKLLFGTALREKSDEYGYISMAKPPYTVLKTRWMSREELYRLSQISDLLERYHDSGAFAKSLTCAVSHAPSPFDFYDGLLTYIETHDGRSVRKLSQTDAFRLLYAYSAAFVPDTAELERLMHEDYEAREARKMPFSVIRREQ